MRTPILIAAVIASTVFATAQQSQPTAPPANPTVPPANPTVPPANQPVQRNPNPLAPPGQQGNPVDRGANNSVFITNSPGFPNNPNMAGRFNTNSPFNFGAVTNTLATMTPVQAQAVVQTQTGLNSLQLLAANIGANNLRQAIDQNPQVQRQLMLMAGQINGLARGPARPSPDMVQRLTGDLFRTFSQTRITPDNQLALAVVIDQMFNSQNLSPDQIDSVVNTGLATLQSSGAPMSAVHTVGCDLHSIAFELQGNPAM